MNPNSPVDNSIVDKKKSISIENLVGNWIAPEYIDSTVQNRAIYKFSGGFASTGYSIEISNLEESVLTGYHENIELPLMRKNDTLAIYGFDDKQYWIFQLIEKDLLKVQEYVDTTYFKSFRGNPIPYYYKRTEKLPPKRIKQYFINNIIVGEYLDIESKKAIEFTSDLKIINFDSYSEFDIVVDFWENPVGNYDIIYLHGEKPLRYENMFHWYFESDTLIIKSLKGEEDYNSGFYKAEPDEVVYKLLKQH